MPSPPSRPTKAQIARRRAVAVAGAVAATALIWLVFIRGGGSEEGGPQTAPGGEVPASVRDLVADLSPEEKIDGILLLGFEGTDADAPIVAQLGERRLGGVLVGAQNWEDGSQLAALVTALRRAGGGDDRIPPLIVAPQEGGPFRAFPDLPPAERQLDIGDTGDPELAERSAREAGIALRDVGIDLNLFPVADVATLDSPVADRAYSDDPGVVAAMTAAAIRGCEAAEIACAPRHFPGLGAASQSTDGGPATVSLDATSLAARDVAPFETAFAEGAPAVVLSHAFYVAYDAVTPGSLSSLVSYDLLREQLGFEGVAITDDLGAGAIKARGAAAEAGGAGPQGGSAVAAAAIAAVQAGADMLLISSPGDQQGVTDAMIEAIGTGEISEDRLDEAIGRVLLLKQELGLIASD
jgi:beta-N-acetylhexosaminidase